MGGSLDSKPSVRLHIQKELVNSRIWGDFGMERGGEQIALLQCHDVAVRLTHDLCALADLDDERSADEHEREVGDHTRR